MDSETMIRFIYLGNLLIEKGPLVLLESCRILQERNIPFHCHLVGAPTAEISLQDMAIKVAQRGLSNVVSIHGARYGEEKEYLLQQADAMVFPTFYCNECFPLVLLEGMKHSLALISTSEGAISDIIEEGVSGFLVEKQNAKALAKAMQKLAEEPSLTRKMGKAGRARYLRMYSEKSFIERLSSILRNA